GKRLERFSADILTRAEARSSGFPVRSEAKRSASRSWQRERQAENGPSGNRTSDATKPSTIILAGSEISAGNPSSPGRPGQASSLKLSHDPASAMTSVQS